MGSTDKQSMRYAPSLPFCLRALVSGWVGCLALAGLALPLWAAELSAREEQLMAQQASSELKAALSLEFELKSAQGIRDLILQERFAEFESLSRHYERRFKTHPKYESALIKLYGALNVDDARLPGKLDKWVAQRPSYISHAARGIYRTDRGYAARGTGFIRETPQERITQMRRLHRDAIADLLACLKENREFSPAYIALIQIDRAGGDGTGAEKAHAEGVRRIPATYYIRHAYLVGLQPRWGGDYSLMQSYASSLDEAARLNPRVWSLRAEVPAQLGYSAWLSRDYSQAIKYYTEALGFGDRLEFLKNRGKIFMATRQYAEAKNDFARYLQYKKSDGEVNDLLRRLEAIK
jgi:hypothetical protein